jgi:phenylacetic acid degradation operon negative regulatory protein
MTALRPGTQPPEADRRSAGPSAIPYVFGALQAGSVPGPAMVALLADLGLAEPTARTMLSRLVRAGHLSTTRRGRVAVYRLEGGFRDQFLRFRHGDEPPNWTGSFHAVIYDIPESLRAVRDGLRDRAAAFGFGMARPGLLIGLADPAEWAGTWVERRDVLVEVATLSCSVSSAARLAERAWSLPEHRPGLEAFADELEGMAERYAGDPPPRRAAFVIFQDVMRSYAGLHLVMPALPAELSPPDWPGRRIPAALGRVSELLGPQLAQHAMSVVESLGLSDLVEPLSGPPRISPAAIHRAGDRTG